MDQDAFRQLLSSGTGSASSQPQPKSRGSLFTAKPKAGQSSKPAEPAFKPRKVKKPGESKYRDRASERRTGEGNDFAHVEAVLQEFEKQIANEDDKDVIEEKRRYLGGDKDHTVLVKGLDFALLEQNRSKAVLSKDDVDALEEAFKEGHLASTPSEHNGPAAKKRRREDLLKELKESRTKDSPAATTSTSTAVKDVVALEEAKKQGKFKPIGFKPIGSASDSKKKSKGDGTERKKKKRKVEGAAASEPVAPESQPPSAGDTLAGSTTAAAGKPHSLPQESEPEPVDMDFDIFGGVEEYKGVDIEEDDDAGEDEGTNAASRKADAEEDSTTPAPPPRRWVEVEESEQRRPILPLPLPQSTSTSVPATQKQQRPEEPEASEDEMEDRPMRLQPLASSALPSIKDLLAMDDAAGSKKKKKKGKAAKKKGKEADDDDD